MAAKPTIGVLDLGASGGRVFAATLERDVLAVRELHRFAHAPQRFWQRAASEAHVVERTCWDLGRLYAGLLDGLGALAASGEHRLTSFGVDTWGSDGTWLNAAGDILGLVGTGRDARWVRARDEIAERVGPAELFRLTGVHADPFCVLNQLYWYARYAPATVAAACHYLPIGSLFHYWLSGERVAETTWMSTTQLALPGASDYNRALFARLDLPLDRMPPLQTPGTRLGTCHTALAAAVGLAPFEVVLPATHDTACAYVAAPQRLGRKPILISSGTWSLVGIRREAPLISEEVYRAGLTNIGGCEEVFFHAVIMGTWPAQQLRQEWSRADGRELTWEAFGALARSAPALGLLLDIDHPLFYAPASMSAAIAQYCAATGQPVPDTRAALARAVYEGLALKTALACDRMQALADYRADEIVIVGGGSQNAQLSQWIADASGLPVRTGSADATALGNALIQARALGWIASYEEGRALLRNAEASGAQESEYQPRPTDEWARAKERLAAWQRR